MLASRSVSQRRSASACWPARASRWPASSQRPRGLRRGVAGALQRGVGLLRLALRRRPPAPARTRSARCAWRTSRRPAARAPRHLGGVAPVARAFVQRQQRQPRLAVEGRALERLVGGFGAVEQAGLHVVLRQRVLRAVALAALQVGALQQVLVHAHRTFELAAAAEQVAQREVQLGGVGVVLHGLDEGVDGLVLLLVEQQVQALEVGRGASRRSRRTWRRSKREATQPSAKATGRPISSHWRSKSMMPA